MQANYFLKLAEITGQRVFYTKNSRLGSVFIKAPDQRVYLLGKTLGEKARWWVASASGIIEFSDPEKALNAFFGACNMKVSGFIRKSSYAKLESADRVKVAKIVKQALCYDGDTWIENPDDLVHTSSYDLWAITTNGKHVARLFDEREFPLNA